jgi:hypothetical protein
MARSDWQELSARALREGRSLREASAAYRSAHRHIRGNPDSPESVYHRNRRMLTGKLLREGVPFHEARRRADRYNPGEWWSLEPTKGAKPPPFKCQACGRIFRRPEQLREHQWTEHAAKRRNPDLEIEGEEVTRGGLRGLVDMPWIVVAGVVAGAFVLMRGANARAASEAAAAAQAATITGGQPMQGQLATLTPYGHQTGSYQSSMDPTNAVPGGTAVQTTVAAPWDVGI